MDENVPIFSDTITIVPGAFALPAALEEDAPEGVPLEQEDVPAIPPPAVPEHDHDQEGEGVPPPPAAHPEKDLKAAEIN